MIYNTTDSASDSWVAALKERLAGQFERCRGEEACADFVDEEEVAHAVACYVEESCVGRAMHARHLAMLASRALASLGERRAARRMLLSGTGLVSETRWEFTGLDAVWVLDMREMTAVSVAPLELAFFGGLLSVLDMTAEVWDDTRGSGVLGLRRLAAAADGLLGRREGRQDDSAALKREIKQVCARKLQTIGNRRAWTDVPVVMELESKKE